VTPRKTSRIIAVVRANFIAEPHQNVVGEDIGILTQPGCCKRTCIRRADALPSLRIAGNFSFQNRRRIR
jgi:hypothetical protein